ncbi:MAG TPA: response regulator [Polyangia bacterium]|jgi:two-component system response regulator|nr:response regulator [Polyangia bacterium]
MKSRVILLVEDNPDDAELAMRAFAKTTGNHDLILARDGVEALDYLLGTGPHAAEPPPAPDLILLDLKLPRVDGLEVLRRLRAEERTRHLPVVVLTSSEQEEDIVNSYKSGANSYVRKPVDFGQFAQAAQQLGAYWLTLNQTARRS